MQFIYNKNASDNKLIVVDDSFHYLFRVRRLKVGDVVGFRNLLDNYLYRYRVVSIEKRRALFDLIESKQLTIEPNKKLHIIWCIIDPKSIYMTIPILNQIGVKKITFIYCDRSQKNYKVDLTKINKILINSAQQCGRTDLMSIETIDSLDDLIKSKIDFCVLDFGGEKGWVDVDTVLIGCEGGFSKEEREKLKAYRKIGLSTDLILKSETAAITIASKLLI